jgi:starch synthase (maltosyl-transferring)
MSQVTHTIIRPIETRVAEKTQQQRPLAHHRVYAIDLTRSRNASPSDLLSWVADTGFDAMLLALPRHMGTADIAAIPPIVEAAVASGLRVQLDLTLDIARDTAASVKRHPEWYSVVRRQPADPRQTPAPPGTHLVNLRAPDAIEAFTEYWAATLHRLGESGISGFRCKPNAAVPPSVWRDLIAGCPEFHFSVWTPGLSDADVRQLPCGCFDIAYNSLAWWDFGAGWFRDELASLPRIAPIASSVGLPAAAASVTTSPAARRVLDVAAVNGHGLLLPMGFEFGMPSDLTHPNYGADDWPRLRDHAWLDLTPAVREANRRLVAHDPQAAAPELLSSVDAPVAVFFEPPAQLTVANRHLAKPTAFDPSGILPMLDGRLAAFADLTIPLAADPIPLTQGEVRVFTGTPAAPIVTARKRDPAATAAEPRVAIEAIEPAVDDGRFAAKRLVGERVTVEADIFVDGHGKLSAALQWRAKDETQWHETPMLLIANDRWSGSFMLERVGPHVFRVVAWPDRFGTWRDELIKKHAAGLDVTLELEEGRLLIETIAEAAPGVLGSLLRKTHKVHQSGDVPDQIALLTADATAADVVRADTRPGQTVSGEMPVNADRRAAEFASWYELFPRNQSGDPARHGTFRDVIGRLPAIRDMGFDVLYFPPIHPIGRTNRKGRNNTMTPSADDPGSPYAIGAVEGGHDAIHPELGTIDDFRALRDAVAEHGLELALDFAIQCSPDHPWLREHPDWFDWRPDGGLRYAENPPKKYEDIVNVDFYAPGAIPGLWLALRDVVAYWASEGVRIFRVDNPHTKPFAFWEWLIADIRATHPDTLFLSEAFTRPKVMYRLAKLGFSQSYTYFTWRDEKWEIEEYLRELTSNTETNVADFFRPNFFVNTPDINPLFLQHSGRAGFLIRAALAATLSGLWGMLQGFEFCESTPLPGREEYADSDKYQIRVRPERAPGDIVDEITRLNEIRRANPALQSHRGLAFHQARNDRVLWYRKANVDRSNVVLVAVSLDPFASQTADVEVPLWEWGLGDDAALKVTDLMRGGDAVWHGKNRSITLDPWTLPFGIWHARPLETV